MHLKPKKNYKKETKIHVAKAPESSNGIKKWWKWVGFRRWVAFFSGISLILLFIIASGLVFLVADFTFLDDYRREGFFGQHWFRWESRQKNSKIDLFFSHYISQTSLLSLISNLSIYFYPSISLYNFCVCDGVFFAVSRLRKNEVPGFFSSLCDGFCE